MKTFNVKWLLLLSLREGACLVNDAFAFTRKKNFNAGNLNSIS